MIELPPSKDRMEREKAGPLRDVRGTSRTCERFRVARPSGFHATRPLGPTAPPTPAVSGPRALEAFPILAGQFPSSFHSKYRPSAESSICRSRPFCKNRATACFDCTIPSPGAAGSIAVHQRMVELAILCGELRRRRPPVCIRWSRPRH